MGRWFNFALVAIMIVGAVLTYDAKHKAERAADIVVALKADIEREKETIRLLRAEWSVLTQPSRLQALVEKYETELGLMPFEVDQIATIDEIPSRPIGEDVLAAQPALTGAVRVEARAQ